MLSTDKIMGIDFGDARTGIALSDISKTLVGETFTITEYNAERVAEKIAKLISERGVLTVVLGYPKNMNGTLGPRAEKSIWLKSELEARCNVKVVLWDERLTTVDAHRILSEAGAHGKKRKQQVDAVAASLILQGYLDSLKLNF